MKATKETPLGKSLGFRLLELLIALGILSIGLAALVQLSAASMTADRQNRLKTAALQLAQEKMEILKGIAYEDLKSEWEIGLTQETLSVRFDRETIVRKDPDGSRAEITVRVYWPAASGVPRRSRIELSTLLSP